MYSIVNKLSQMVSAELSSNAAGSVFRFDDVPNISQNDIVVYGLEAYTATQCAKDEQGRTVIAAADASGLLVTLYDSKSNAVIEDMPYYDFIKSLNGGFTQALNNFELNIPQCEVKITNTGTIAAGQVALFRVIYFKK